MTQEQIDKLLELKKLLDAGILTPEEMESEKAKVLGTAKTETVDEPVADEPTVEQVKEEIADDAVPLVRNNDGRIRFEEPSVEQQTIPRSEEKSGISKKSVYISLGVLAAIVVAVLFAKKSSEPTYYNIPDSDTETVYATDSAAEDEVIIYDESKIDLGEDDDEFASNEELQIVGGHYKINKHVFVYTGPGDNFAKAKFEGQGEEGVAEYNVGSIIETNGNTKNGYVFVSACGCQGGHGFNQDGWIPLSALTSMQTCSNCNGKGYFNQVCPDCNGEGFYMCSCHGTGKKVCSVCDGVGSI